MTWKKRGIRFAGVFLAMITMVILYSYLFSNVRQDRETHITDALIQMREADLKYHQEHGAYLSGSFSLAEINGLLGLKLEERDFYLFFEKEEDKKNSLEFKFTPAGENAFTIFAFLVKNGTEYTRDMFSIAIDQRPVNLEGVPPNPCCISSGLCPTLGKCILGK